MSGLLTAWATDAQHYAAIQLMRFLFLVTKQCAWHCSSPLQAAPLLGTWPLSGIFASLTMSFL